MHTAKLSAEKIAFGTSGQTRLQTRQGRRPDAAYRSRSLCPGESFAPGLRARTAASFIPNRWATLCIVSPSPHRGGRPRLPGLRRAFPPRYTSCHSRTLSVSASLVLHELLLLDAEFLRYRGVGVAGRRDDVVQAARLAHGVGLAHLLPYELGRSLRFAPGAGVVGIEGVTLYDGYEARGVVGVGGVAAPAQAARPGGVVGYVVAEQGL